MPPDEANEPEQPREAVIGDGVITLSEGEREMAQVDLPESVASELLTLTVGNIQANNAEARDLTTLPAGVLKGAMARNFDELGTVESRANSGVIATPVASPAVQTGT